MTITDKSLVERDVRGSEYSTAFTASVGVTINGWNTIYETGAVKLANNDMCLAKDVTRRAFTDGSCVIAYATLPTTAIDVTSRSTLDIGICTGNEIVVEVILFHLVFVVHRTHSTCCI